MISRKNLTLTKNKRTMNKNKNLLLCGVLLLVAFAGVFGALILKSKTIFSTTLLFDKDETLSLSVVDWKYINSDDKIVVSSSVEAIFKSVNKEKDYVFYTTQAFYTQDDNSLTLYVPQCEKNIPTKSDTDIQVVVKELTTDEFNDYQENYQKYGLKELRIFR